MEYIPTTAAREPGAGSRVSISPGVSRAIHSCLQDYLYQLADSMRELFPHVEDKYLFELEVRRLPVKYLIPTDQV